jgi:hypothetical protein
MRPPDGPPGGTPRERLLAVIADVRRRWRVKLALRGLIICGGTALGALLVLSWLVNRTSASALTLLTFAALALLGVIALAVRFLALPLSRRVTDERIALYLEEHEPSLQAALITALDASASMVSPAFAEHTLEDAIERCRAIDYGRRVDRAQLNRFATAFSAIAVVGIGLTLFGPGVLRNGAEALLSPLRGEDGRHRIAVTPGTATVPRGADQLITARLSGWDDAAQQVEIVMRADGDSSFQRIPMTLSPEAEYEVLLFGLDRAIDYYLEADGVRTQVFRLDVADLPYVERLELEYRYPSYTGLPPEVLEDGGDIVALRGTRVVVRARTTVQVAAGRILLDGGRSVALQPGPDGRLEGVIAIEREGWYSIALETADGATHDGSRRYHIDVVTDRAPAVRISRPGHDTQPTMLEEVFVEVTAEDDFGVAAVDLVYSVNGGPDRSIELLRATRPLSELAAAHTFYLEEYELKPGDLIAYHARVRDNGAPAQSATSDIFFMTIRPFGRDYRQAEGAPAQGGQGENPGELSRRQREIITATFNVVRDSASYPTEEYAANVNTVALMQERLREQVVTLVTRMQDREVTRDSMFAQIAAILPRAAREMEAALTQLRARIPRDALPAEQRALLELQRAEALFRDVQVMQQQGGGGGGGGDAPSAEDLADLFELGRDALSNQYETVQRGERQQNAQQAEVDEALQRLRELARRQEQANERLRRQAQARMNQQGGGGSAQVQRQLADETEQAARQLERLSRETQQPALADAARELQRAADAMRRSAANARSGNTAEGSSALEQLEEARRRLERSREDTLGRQAREAAAHAERLARQQREIAERMDRLHQLDGAERNAESRRLIERKEEQARGVAELERELDRLAGAARTAQERDAARGLQEAGDAIREGQLRERIQWSRNFAVASEPSELASSTERQIGEQLDDVRQRVAQAVGSLGSGGDRRADETLDRLRRLARGLESMQERTTIAGEAAREAQRGQQQGGQQAGQQQGGGQQGGAQGTMAGGRSEVGLSPEQARQFRSEVRERLAEAQGLRQQLAREGRDVSELDGVIRGLRSLEAGEPWNNTANVQRLQAALVDGIKQFEFGLRRDMLGADRDRLFLSGTDEVPPGYREMVEEYYRRLARERR